MEMFPALPPPIGLCCAVYGVNYTNDSLSPLCNFVITSLH